MIDKTLLLTQYEKKEVNRNKYNTELHWTALGIFTYPIIYFYVEKNKKY